VAFQGRLQGVPQADQRQPALGALAVATAVAAQDALVGVEEEDEEVQVVVVVEQAQVQPGQARQPDQDELRGDVGNAGVQTSNLLVKSTAVRSGLAAQDDEHRPAAVTGDLPGRRIVTDPLGELRVPRGGVLGTRPGRESQSDEAGGQAAIHETFSGIHFLARSLPS
jgi:hypothetical protein